jgi:hypothetical protein
MLSFLNRSFSSSESQENKGKKFDQKLKRMREETRKNKKQRNLDNIKPKVQIKLPNKSILANLIHDNIKANSKLDQEEISRANILLKTVDVKGGTKATLMTSYINNATLEKDNYVYENENGKVVKIPKYYTCEINVLN